MSSEPLIHGVRQQLGERAVQHLRSVLEADQLRGIEFDVHEQYALW